MNAAHDRERSLIGGLTEDQARAPSALPGWTRGHVLASRLAFARAACRQIGHARTGRLTEFYDGGRAGRDAEIEANAGRAAGELVRDVRQALTALDENWSQIGPADWGRPAMFRGRQTLASLLLGCWRESELHSVDIKLGFRPSGWSGEFCLHLFEFLAPRVPDSLALELSTPAGGRWTVGRPGERISVRGAMTDLAAWLAGREPEGPVESPAGTLPRLRRLREAQTARGPAIPPPAPSSAADDRAGAAHTRGYGSS